MFHPLDSLSPQTLNHAQGFDKTTCSVSFYFLLSLFPSTFLPPDHLGTNCSRYGMKTTPCLTQPLYLDGIQLHFYASSPAQRAATRIAVCSYPGKNSSIRTLPPLCAFCSAMMSGRSYQPVPWLTQVHLGVFCHRNPISHPFQSACLAASCLCLLPPRLSVHGRHALHQIHTPPHL